MENVGKRLKMLRILNGYTQEALAAMIGAKQASLTLWEKGAYNPAKKVLPALAEALKVEQSYLLFGTPPVKSATWLPVPAARSHFTEAMNRDIADLMPGFIRENGIDFAVRVELADGKCYLAGREGRCGWLILVPNKLSEGFEQAFKNANFELYTVNGMSEVTVVKFGKEHLKTCHSVINKRNITMDVNKLSTELNIKKNVLFNNEQEIEYSEVSTVTTAELIFRAYGISLTKYPISESIINRLSKFFADRYDDLVKLTPGRLDVDALATEADESLKEGMRRSV